MAKFINTVWKVVVNGVDLSDHAFGVDTPQEREQIDVSGYGGNREFLPGLKDDTLTISFLNDFGTNSVHQTLYPLFATEGTTFPVYVQPFSTSGTAGTNPLYGGSASLFTYNGAGGAPLNERGEQTAEFKPAPNSEFAWGTVAP